MSLLLRGGIDHTDVPRSPAKQGSGRPRGSGESSGHVDTGTHSGVLGISQLSGAEGSIMANTTDAGLLQGLEWFPRTQATAPFPAHPDPAPFLAHPEPSQGGGTEGLISAQGTPHFSFARWKSSRALLHKM